MTEIQWLCDILLNHKLPEMVKQKFIARIGEAEARLSQNQYQQRIAPSPVVDKFAQSPSTQALLEKHSVPAPIGPLVKSRNQAVEIDKETGRPTVSNGDGTRGPRKF